MHSFWKVFVNDAAKLTRSTSYSKSKRVFDCVFSIKLPTRLYFDRQFSCFSSLRQASIWLDPRLACWFSDMLWWQRTQWKMKSVKFTNSPTVWCYWQNTTSKYKIPTYLQYLINYALYSKKEFTYLLIFFKNPILHFRHNM